MTTVYDETGLPIDMVDSYGAEAEFVHDAEGNTTSRRAAAGPLASSSVFTSGYSYDSGDELAGITDPAGQQYGLLRRVAGSGAASVPCRLQTAASQPPGRTVWLAICPSG